MGHNQTKIVYRPKQRFNHTPADNKATQSLYSIPAHISTYADTLKQTFSDIAELAGDITDSISMRFDSNNPLMNRSAYNTDLDLNYQTIRYKEDIHRSLQNIYRVARA